MHPVIRIEVTDSGISNHPGFPVGTDLVVTHGDGSITAAMLELDAQTEQQGFLSYGFNTEPAASADNISLNVGVDGNTFIGLGGTGNVQGQYSRANGFDFLQVEYEQSIRFNSGNRTAAANGLATSIDNLYTIADIPLPAPFALMLLGGALGWHQVRMRIL